MWRTGPLSTHGRTRSGERSLAVLRHWFRIEKAGRKLKRRRLSDDFAADASTEHGG